MKVFQDCASGGL